MNNLHHYILNFEKPVAVHKVSVNAEAGIIKLMWGYFEPKKRLSMKHNSNIAIGTTNPGY